MSYRIEIASIAEAEVDQAFLWTAQQVSQEAAGRWYQGLLQAIESLAEMPRRCPLARENDDFSQEIRQLLYGKGRSKYRVLFTVIEDLENPTVRILHMRHAAQQPINTENADEDS
jgi:plasmid stabilization system protein ParE